MFIYAGNGRTDGRETDHHCRILMKSWWRISCSAIHARREGIFEIDLQLRPYGKAGSLAVSLDAFRRYFAPEGPAWAYERQALVKLRPIAGDAQLGRADRAAARSSSSTRGEPFDVTAMRAMRERQVRHLVKGGTFNAKYSPGGLVDIEYLVQGLQITHGRDNPALRQTNTRQPWRRWQTPGILSTGGLHPPAQSAHLSALADRFACAWCAAMPKT